MHGTRENHHPRRRLATARLAAMTMPAFLTISLISAAALARPSSAMRLARLPDGSGTLQLPAGWRITDAAGGAVCARGPQGLVSLGFNTAIWPGARLSARYGTPLRVVRQLAPQFGYHGFQVLAARPQPVAGAQGALIQFKAGVPGQGPMEGLVLVLVRPLGGGTDDFMMDNTFVYYSSLVAAPVARFRQSLPVLLRIWKSWRLSPRLFADRRNAAAANLRAAAHSIESSAITKMEDASEESAAMHHVLTGTWSVEDDSGRRGEWSAQNLGGQIRSYNQEHPNAPAHAVPYGQLHR